MIIKFKILRYIYKKEYIRIQKRIINYRDKSTLYEKEKIDK